MNRLHAQGALALSSFLAAGFISLLPPAPVAAAAAGTTVNLATTDLSNVRAYPNPWRVTEHGPFPVSFAPLTPGSVVRIYTVSGRWVTSLIPNISIATWNLTNSTGDRVASGLYLYVITADGGQKKTGQIAVIR